MIITFIALYLFFGSIVISLLMVIEDTDVTTIQFYGSVVLWPIVLPTYLWFRWKDSR